MTTPAVRSYGVREALNCDSDAAAAIENLQSLGYAVLDGGYTSDQIAAFREAFDIARQKSEREAGGQDVLQALDEHNTIRAPLYFNRDLLSLATNPGVLEVVGSLIGGYQVLSQQNGIINPPDGAEYNQGAWHRDLPYQHVVFSRPMAINALFCVDDFTEENGATLVLPASHKQEAFPSSHYIAANARKVLAPAGSYILLDCMCYHTGGSNRTGTPRRAVNHVYTSPVLRQQIDLPALLGEGFTQDPALRRLLGYEVRTPGSVREYLAERRGKLAAG